MPDYVKYIIVGALALALIAGIVVCYCLAKKNPDFNATRLVARVGVFGAMSTLLYAVPFFKFSLPFFPSFLEIHLDEIPAFIAGFAYGPLAGIGIIAVKTIIKLPLTSTMCVGEIGDFVLSSIYVGIATLVYKKHRTLGGAIVGFAIATVAQIGAAMLLNVYALIPFYVYMMGWPEEALLGMMQKAMPSITDVRWSYGLIAVGPFNVFKDIIVTIVTFLCYHFLHKPLRLEKKPKKIEGQQDGAK